MDPISLLVAGPTTALAGAGLITTLLGALWAFRKRIPHPTEFWIIGVWFRLLRIHTHEKFDLVIDVHEATNVPPRAKLYVFVKAGRHEKSSSTETSNREGGMSCACPFFQRIPLHVRQKDDEVEIRVYRSGPVSSELLGATSLAVHADLIDADFPRNKQVNLLDANKQVTVRLFVSFFKVEPVPAVLAGAGYSKSKLVQQALIQSQLAGRPVSAAAVADMGPKARLIFFSKVLQGPLRVMTRLGTSTNPWNEHFFRATTTKEGVWMWCYWKDQKALDQKKNPIGVIPLLSITVVLRNDADGNRNQFFLRYSARSGVRDLYMERVDRDRDLWVDGLYEFIQMVRDDFNKEKEPEAKEAARKAQTRLLDKEEEIRRESVSATSSGPQSTNKADADGKQSQTGGPSSIASAEAIPKQEEPPKTLVPKQTEEERQEEERQKARATTNAMLNWMNDPQELDTELSQEILAREETLHQSVSVHQRNAADPGTDTEERRRLLESRHVYGT